MVFEISDVGFTLKQGHKDICITSDIWYDLIDTEYINPDDFVIPIDARKVRDAIDTLNSFVAFLENNGILEYS